jgi:hypothetical protein
MEIALKAVRARARYEAVKAEFMNPNKALEEGKFALIEACNDVMSTGKLAASPTGSLKKKQKYPQVQEICMSYKQSVRQFNIL